MRVALHRNLGLFPGLGRRSRGRGRTASTTDWFLTGVIGIALAALLAQLTPLPTR